MIRFYKSNIHGKIQPIDDWEQGCWVRCIRPNESELEQLINDYHIEPEFIRSAIDEEESSHIDTEDDNTLIILDIPIQVDAEGDLEFSTVPLSIILTPKNVITICMNENMILDNFANGTVKNVYTHYRVQFILKIMFSIATRYIMNLRQIDRYSAQVEKSLEKSLKNSELMKLLDIKKSLVYLSSSLKANERTIERIRLGRSIKLYEEDHDLLEDLLIEIKQGIDMSSNSLSIISSTTDAYTGIVSNNLNIVMKVLTSVTLIIAIPTLISGIYGMNVEGLPLPHFWFVMAFSAVVTAVTFILLRKKNML
ncbi:MAG: magnesium transporter CorA family protein [Oscillospiraceae bacterium]|nr:magnesium transporter CorA family protein [Oscillospiraceae bacterium]